ncbi:MAG TPA: NACHT domain-containing protein, partial [Anaerolineales bacterium]|nr:NACHT domain-containing protein [Anaerolineales bacterium]
MEALAFLAANLGPALFWVFQEFIKEGVIKPAAKPLADWIVSGYEARGSQDALHQALLGALDELRADEQIDSPDRLIATLKLTGQTPETWRLLAASAVEMVEPDSRYVPPALLQTLDFDETRRNLLVRFLYLLRKHLAGIPGYDLGIAYANDLAKIGRLGEITRSVSQSALHTRRIMQLEEALASHYGLTTDEQQARHDYLETLRQQLRYLPMPLADPGTAAVPDPELFKVFVPLMVRDLRAEAEAHRQVERRATRPGAEEQPEREVALRPVQIVEILSKYRCFALIGKAGCGKTTLLRWMALAFAENRAAEDLGWQSPPLFPIFLRLRNFGTFLSQRNDFSDPGPGALTAYLEHYFRTAYNLDLAPKFFANHLKAGNCLVLLDGLDEVSQGRSEVAQQVSAFIRFYGRGNHFGLASRPRGYDSVKEYLNPSGFAECDVYPLDAQGIRQLVGKLIGFIVSNPRQAVDDSLGLSQRILAAPRLKELASTPLFCTALTLVYKHHGSVLPERQVDVLEQIVDLLLGFWKAQEQDLAKRHELAVYDGTDE